MKSPARLFVFLTLAVGFLFLSPQKILAGAFDFSLDKFIDTKLKNRQTTNTTNVSIEETEGYRLNVIIAESTDMLIPLDPELNKERVRAVPALAQVMTKIYEYPPASAVVYTHDFLANAGLIAKPAYAQGIGFAGLTPLLPIWKASRNISYAILIIIMVTIGFMIIFRAKIDPKTVISVQAALPRIVITLLLITFSYPIAGFLIDVMYLSILIIIQLLADAAKDLPIDMLGWAGFIKDAPLQQEEFTTGGFWKLIISVFSVGLIPAFFQQNFANLPGVSIGVGGSFGIAALLKATIGSILGVSFLPHVLLTAIGLVAIILFLIGLGLLFTLIRLTFLLINSYIQLLLAIIFGPLLLLKEAIPGQSAFKEWVQNLIANLVVFPATVGVIYLSWIFTAVMWQGNLWGPPLTFVGGTNLAGGNPIAIFIGLGIIYMSPNLVASVKKAFHAKPALPITAGSAFAPLTGAASTGMGAMSQYYYMTQIFGGAKGPLSTFISKIPGFKAKS